MRAIMTPGTSCKFYINGVLEATHTTNLPDVASLYLNNTLVTLDASAKTANLGAVTIRREI